MTGFDFGVIQDRINAATDEHELGRIGRALSGAFVGPTTELERLIFALDAKRAELRRDARKAAPTVRG